MGVVGCVLEKRRWVQYFVSSRFFGVAAVKQCIHILLISYSGKAFVHLLLGQLGYLDHPSMLFFIGLGKNKGCNQSEIWYGNYQQDGRCSISLTT